MQLFAYFFSDDALEITHHCGVRMRPRDRADAVKRVAYVGHPITQRLVHGVLEGVGAGRHRHHLGTQKLHAEDIWRLSLDILGAHVDDAWQTNFGADRRGRNAMLPSPGLRYNPPLTHVFSKERLTYRVIHLMSASVVQILSL